MAQGSANKDLEYADDADAALEVANLDESNGKQRPNTDIDVVEAMKNNRNILRGR
jgi:hypothetical protein